MPPPAGRLDDGSVPATLDQAVGRARGSSLAPRTFGLARCAPEMTAAGQVRTGAAGLPPELATAGAATAFELA